MVCDLKTYKLFISGIFHVILSNYDWPWLTETTESKTSKKGRQLHPGLESRISNSYFYTHIIATLFTTAWTAAG